MAAVLFIVAAVMFMQGRPMNADRGNAAERRVARARHRRRPAGGRDGELRCASAVGLLLALLMGDSGIAGDPACTPASSCCSRRRWRA